MKPVPEREAAKAAGDKFYRTGKPCRNGHIEKRYTSNGLCVVCAISKTIAYQKRAPWHPARIEAKERGDVHYSTGKPCKHGHDRRFVSNGVCVECGMVRLKKYHSARPRLGAKWAREQRAKDPTGHRQSSGKWAKGNPAKVATIRKRMIARDPEKYRQIAIVKVHAYKAQKLSNGGMFTPDDIGRLYEKQDGKCAGCGKQHDKMEIDHIIAVSKGGRNDATNLQLLCRHCNRSKGKKDDDVWRSEQGFSHREH